MKLGIVGKGGTGKTTLAALISTAYVDMGRRVVAVDTDSNPNLALSLGLDEAVANQAPLVPRSLVVGSSGGLGSAQLVADYGLPTPAGVTLLHAMRVDQAGSGCTCAGHASVRSLLGAALDEEADVTLVDMEAGLEHLSRSGGTLAHADVVLVVMEPSRKSALTAARTRALAEELGIPRVAGVGNKAHLPDDGAFFEQLSAEYGVPLAAVVPFDAAVVAADREGRMLERPSEGVRRAVEEIIAFVDSPQLRHEALERERQRLERRLSELTQPA
ncbi:MAG: AAA family ATPase [Acidimicrobiales bacterium]